MFEVQKNENIKPAAVKKILTRASILSLIILLISFQSFSQVYVTVRPSVPKITKSVQPSPAHVWVEENWKARHDHYEYAGGRWMLPPHPGWIWVPGRWINNSKGWQWVQGSWRRGRRY